MADRELYGDRQAAFLEALQGRAQAPPGFNSGDLDAAADALLRKRIGLVADRWPALAHTLPGFRSRFADWARCNPPQPDDGLAFAQSLPRSLVGPDIATEILMSQSSLRCFYLAARVSPRGLLIAVRVAGRPARILALRAGRNDGPSLG